MKQFFALLPVLALLSGCTGTGKTMVMCPPAQQHFAKTYAIVEKGSTVGSDSEVKELFEHSLREGLAEANMKPGNDLTIEYRFIQFDEGSRFVRYLSGGFGNAGEGEMTIEVTFRDKCNQEIGKAHVGGKISAGFFGGSIDHATEQAAKQVVRYVVTNYKN